MSTVGYSTLEIIPSVRNLRAQLESQTGRDLAAAGKSGGQKFGDSAGREAGGRFKSQFGAATRNLLAPAAGVLAGAGLVAGFKDIIGRASQAEQAVGGVQAVFKDYASTVVADSQKAAEGLGLSSTAYQELITLSGALLKNKGIRDFAEQGKSLIQIGADLAAQYGGSTREAVEALNSALRGESDPIERYAVSLNQTAINAVLAANGQDALTGAALEQAKTMARLQVITEQTADAQGANAREADTFAGASARASAQFEEMRTELGQKLLPVMSKFVGFLNNDALPALSGAGGVIQDAANGFGSLPAPIKAATSALLAFKAAQSFGAGGLAASGLAASSSGLDTLRLRAMDASDAYRELRAGQVEIIGNSAKFTPAVGRMSASLSVLQAGARGAGSGLRRSLGSITSLIGGPWGAAFIGGAALVTHFWQENKAAKARVDDLTASLNKQNGALTENSKKQVFESLRKSGAIDDARKLGIGLDLVTQAALGSKPAVAGFNATLHDLALALPRNAESVAVSGTIESLRRAVGGQNDDVAKAVQLWRDEKEALGGAAKATDQATNSIEGYSTKLAAAKDAVQKLLDKENERRNKNLGNRRDSIGLQQAIFDARREAFDGPKGLDITSEAGRANQSALLDLAGQWNDSAASVKNAEGAYVGIRVAFLQTAKQMGATKDQAKALADELLGIPKSSAYTIATPGMKKALEDAKRLRESLEGAATAGRNLSIAQGNKNRDQLSDIRRATGGLIRGPGTGTSDSILMYGSNGEFMQRKAAVDYYGVDFMRRLNSLQIPRFAGGGQVGGTTTVNHAGVSVAVGTVVAQDVNVFLRDVQDRARRSNLDGVKR